MSWDAVGALAEIAGALAVIGSIIYLALQIRENTISNRITANQNTTDQYAAFTNLLLLNDDLRSIWRRGRSDIAQLNVDERERFYYLNMNLSWYYSSQHFQYRAGAIDEVEWAQSLGLIRNSWLAHEGVRTWWQEDMDRARLTVPFVELIEKELADLTAAR